MKTTVFSVKTNTGYPSVCFTDDLNKPRKIHRLYRRIRPGCYGYMSHGDFYITKETRPEIVEALDKQEWSATHDCLATAHWLL